MVRTEGLLDREGRRPVLFADLARAASRFGTSLADSAASLLSSHSSARSFGIALGLDKTLAWQMHTMATAASPEAILAAMPGRLGCDKIVRAMQSLGLNVQGVELARAELENVLRRRSISRIQLKALALGSAAQGNGKRSADQLHRQAFQAQRALRGVSIAGTVSTTFVAPESSAGPVTIVLLSLVHDLVRNMSVGPIPVMHRPSPANHDGEHRIDAAPKSASPQLLTELCSDGIAPDSISVLSIRDTEVACVDPPPERTDGLDIAFAEAVTVTQGVSGPEALPRSLTMLLALPTETAVCDVFVHKSIANWQPEVGLYFHSSPDCLPANHPDFLRHPYAPDAEWVSDPRLTGRLSHLNGKYQRLLHVGEDMVRSKIDEFQCFRIRMEYPPTPTGLLIRCTDE